MDERQCVFVWDHVAGVIWRGAVDRAAAHRLEQAGAEVLRRFPNGAALMGIVESTAEAPDAEMRKLSAAINDRLARAGIVGIAGVISLTGFAGSVMRGVITGLTLISRADYPFKTFAGHAEGVEWLSRTLAERNEVLDAALASQVIGDTRREYEQFWNENYGAGPKSGTRPTSANTSQASLRFVR